MLLLLIGNVKLWHITAVVFILDLMQFHNTEGIFHLAGALFGLFMSNYCKTVLI
jgi:hypothetical protein